MRKILLFGSLSSISANLRFIHSSNYSDLNFYSYCIFTGFEIVPPLNIFQVNLLCFKNLTTRIQRQIQNLPHEIKLTSFSLLNFITSLYIESSIRNPFRQVSGITALSKLATFSIVCFSLSKISIPFVSFFFDSLQKQRYLLFYAGFLYAVC